jgi:alkylated DNA nucleotide flippase Atl1
MDLQEDWIVDISEARQKFFGCTGKMLLPGTATVAALVRKIPAGRLISSDVLRKALASKFNVQVTCPVTTQKTLQAIARGPDKTMPCWRVVKKNGELLAVFPGGVEAQASRLAAEGFPIDRGARALRVANFQEYRIDEPTAFELAGGSPPSMGSVP